MFIKFFLLFKIPIICIRPTPPEVGGGKPHILYELITLHNGSLSRVFQFLKSSKESSLLSFSDIFLASIPLFIEYGFLDKIFSDFFKSRFCIILPVFLLPLY